MVRFILNKKEISTDMPPGTLLLDFIRYSEHLKGTKIGCREGDCGACTVLVGEIKDGKLLYTSATSCLMATGNAQGKHIVTIEGINLQELNVVQKAFAEEGATQCGFCTPGFIVSLTGFCIIDKEPDPDSALKSIDGNICRCTGYKSIERASKKVNDFISQRNKSAALDFAVKNNIIPEYFLNIQQRLSEIQIKSEEKTNSSTRFLGGGTDLYVQQHDTMPTEEIAFLYDRAALKGIIQNGNTCEMGAGSTVTDIAESPIFLNSFPDLSKYMKLVSSTQIRNMATVGGNFTNASPIGDLTVFFLALNAGLTLTNGTDERNIALNDFYKGYKILDKLPEEIIEKITFELPEKDSLFNFEKVCKRTHLDIASVNSAIHLKMNRDIISVAYLSAGGVGPIPMRLSKGEEYLKGKSVTPDNIQELIQIVQTEISPISDARGTATYKRFLLSQLIRAHFITMFPQMLLQNLITVPA